MRILLIRLRLIGDVVFTTPAIRALRRRYPDAQMSYLVEEPAAPVVRGNPHLDEVLVIPRRRGLARVADDARIARALRQRAFDVVIDFHGGPRSSWLAWLTGAPSRIGYTMPGRTWMYTTAVPRSRELRARHSVENQWDLLTSLDVPPPDQTRDRVEMAEDPIARARVDERLSTAGVATPDLLVVVHVSAGNPFRRWPVPSFVALVVGLVREQPARRILLTSGPSEVGAADAVAAAAQDELEPALRQRVIRCGEFDLPELRALIARADLFIGGDSGPLHIAGTTDTPVVAVFGPTLAARSAPWRHPALVSESVEPGPLPCRPCDQRRCVTDDYRCLRDISPRTVLAAAVRAIERAGGSEPAAKTIAGATAAREPAVQFP